LTPDGKAIAARRDGKWSLYPLDGSEPRPLAFLGERNIPFQWSADGRMLYLIHRDERPLESAVDVYRLNVATGRRELFKALSPPDPAGVQSIGRVVVTPDGQSYCYTYSQTLSSLHVVEGLR
jgi:hypothetical protein